MSLPFCRFNHFTSLHARGNKIRLAPGGTRDWSADLREVLTLTLEPWSGIESAVHVRENVVHLLTTSGIYEVNGERGDLRYVIISKIAETL